MHLIIKLFMILCTCGAIGGFICAFAAHLQLQFYIDHDRVLAETGESGWKIFGSILAPMEFYRKKVEVIWKIRRYGLLAFAISVGCMAVIAIIAAATGIKIG